VCGAGKGDSPRLFFYLSGDACRKERGLDSMAQIKASDLTFCYEGSYDNVFEHADFQIDTDWRCGLIGRNGEGKTTLMGLLAGKNE